jgi:hypothetical protein
MPPLNFNRAFPILTYNKVPDIKGNQDVSKDKKDVCKIHLGSCNAALKINHLKKKSKWFWETRFF